MDITAFIDSGILENHCLGFCTPEESMQIEMLSEQYPAIKTEIEKVRRYFEDQLLAKAVKPAPAIKIAVMQAVYKQQAAIDYTFPPLIDDSIASPVLKNWVECNHVKMPLEDFDELFIQELPSTEQVINFIVAAKNGHEEEIHKDFTEYLFVINGSCIMNFNGKERTYNSGDIIIIQPGIPHFATVTSSYPMLALVQRQLRA